MSDDLIFREVDEDLRQERLKQYWAKYGSWVIGAAVGVVVLVAGFRGLEWYQNKQAVETGTKFAQALRLADSGKEAEALKTFEELAQGGTGGYPVLARFAAAAAKAKSGDRDGAVAAYDQLARDAGDPVLQDLARIKAALVLVDTASKEEIATRVGDIAEGSGPWRLQAWEIRGLVAFRTGDMNSATKAFSIVASERETSQEMRERAEIMLALIAPKLKIGTSETVPKADK